MRQWLRASIGIFLIFSVSSLFGQTRSLDYFRKVIISPYIEVSFVQGDKESITIESCSVDPNKLNIEVKNGTLWVYLDGAKTIPRDRRDNTGQNTDLYPNRTVVANVVFKSMEALSVRGEETFVFQSAVSADEFDLRLYGEPEVTFPEVHFSTLNTVIYGEGIVDVQSGSADEQFYKCYGEGRVNASNLTGRQAKLTAYGEADFNINVSDRIRITSFGDARLRYKGNPEIKKGINFGDMALERID